MRGCDYNVNIDKPILEKIVRSGSRGEYLKDCKLSTCMKAFKLPRINNDDTDELVYFRLIFHKKVCVYGEWKNHKIRETVLVEDFLKEKRKYKIKELLDD